MTYPGRVQNGMVILDPPAQLPEGAEVTVQLNDANALPENRPLMKYAGQAQDLPADASRSIDRLLYGEREA
jgi:hypothetical protein